MLGMYVLLIRRVTSDGAKRIWLDALTLKATTVDGEKNLGSIHRLILTH